MVVLTPEVMFSAAKLPHCSPQEIKTLNMKLMQHLERYEYGTEAYWEAVAEFHYRVDDRSCRVARPVDG
jgi:hypothetical protein